MTIEINAINVIDCLGRVRSPNTVFPDGSWNCPFCWAAVSVDTPEWREQKCPNPACFARGGNNPPYPPDVARVEIEHAKRREQDRAAHMALEKWSREYRERQRVEEAQRLSDIALEARRRGACDSCAVESARWGRSPKFTKHRKGCPRHTR